jgi:hypothetical protein
MGYSSATGFDFGHALCPIIFAEQMTAIASGYDRGVIQFLERLFDQNKRIMAGIKNFRM